ncbi:MAG: 2-C-methyl-D-erythritol 4-phosphate cytidylyltransferase [Candidatus Omnitrophica bacterium]|nr:2-C-methyl-D-erythritol 4-phosphate cytidylyltransferase [Candidatus Omnitrophota bacterium]
MARIVRHAKASRVVAVVAAAGAGRRLGGRRPKLLLPLAGRPILIHTLQRLAGCSLIGGLVIVARRADLRRIRTLLRRHRIPKVLAVVPGGPTRLASVGAGIAAVPAAAEFIVIHDGARPLVSHEVIARTLAEARRSGAAVAAVPVAATIKQQLDHTPVVTLDRRHLWAAQTPQAFRARLIRRAYDGALRSRRAATDDAALVEHLGHRVALVAGDERNIKVTTPPDLWAAEAFLAHG